VAEIAREVPAYSKKIMGIVADVQKKAESISSNLNSISTEVKPDKLNEKVAGAPASGPDNAVTGNLPGTSNSDNSENGSATGTPTSTTTAENTPPHEEIQKVQVVGGEVGKLTSFALSGVGTLVDLLTAALFIPLIALFLLLEKKLFAQRSTDLFRNILETKRIDSEIHRMLRGFFVGNLIIGTIMAVVLIVVFTVLGLKNSVSLGLITGFLNLVPLIGPLISMILPLSAGLLQFSSASPFIVMAAVIIVLHFSTANFIVPKFVGGHVNLNGFASTISLLFWGWLWGAIGVLLAIPLTALIRIFLENYAPTVRLAKLFAGASPSKGVPK
jgi:predicted PurR-regulated permease PerM